VPLVRLVGGLRDTVIPTDRGMEQATGFGFEYYSPYTFYETLKDAVTLYRDDRDAFQQLARNGMEQNFSWTETAKNYLKIYKK